MKLPNDVARCDGAKDGDHLHERCIDCRRRTEKEPNSKYWVINPILTGNNYCGIRIAPDFV